MRVAMKKYLFVGTHKAHDQFFERAQVEGMIEFISFSKKKEHLFPKEVLDLQSAIRVLKHQQVSHDPVALDRERIPFIVEEILITKREVENYHEEIRHLKTEIVKTAPLGEFDVEELRALAKETNREFQFFFVRHDRMRSDEIPKEFHLINREFDFDYYFYLGKERYAHPLLNEIEVNSTLSELRDKKRELEALSKEKERALGMSAAYYNSLLDHLLQEVNSSHLKFAKDEIGNHLDQQLFVIEAWLPENKIAYLGSLTDDLPIDAIEVKIEKGDKIPTFLENDKLSEVGQDLVYLYDTPSIEDKDPSPWVIWSFAIFFAMIISDACYGLLFLILAFVLRKKFKDCQGTKKRIVKLLTLLSCTTIIWGVMVGSYFSIKIEPNNKFNRITLLYNLAYHKVKYEIKAHTENYSEWIKEYPRLAKIADPGEFIQEGKVVKGKHFIYPLMEELYDSILMEIALLVGIIHIGISFMRNLYRNWSGVGWIIALWGGYLFFPKILDAVSLPQYMGWMTPQWTNLIGYYMLVGGLLLALILSLIQEKWGGLATFFKLIEVFADTLSYLRLYALGLASMVMAATMNDIGTTMVSPYIGWLIILLGHCVNISLAVMAGVIHGLRLNFLEWYHHSFEGGGYKFNPLRLLVKE